MSSNPMRHRKGNVVDLGLVRSSRRQQAYRDRLDHVLEGNRRALERLFHSGLLWTRQGTRAGRDLLLAHQHLIKVVDLLSRAESGDAKARRAPEPLYAELDLLLAKSDQLATRTDEFVASLR